MFAPDTPARESGGYPEPGAIQDVANHPDNSLPDPGLPSMKHSTEMAGDVIPIPGEKSMGSGVDSNATDYAIGKKSDPKVVPMPRSTTNDWAKRYGQR